MTHIEFERVKQRLFEEYEDQLAELIEGKLAQGKLHVIGDVEGAELTVEERELRDAVPEHLRVSYPRQQLLCLRARRARPVQLPVYLKPQNQDTTDNTAHRTVMTDEQRHALEAALFELDLHESLEGLQCITNDPQRRQMRRLQEESVRRLQRDVLEQERCSSSAANKKAGEGKEEAVVGEYAGSREGGKVPAAVVGESERERNLQLLRDGGVNGEEFTSHRMAVLKELEEQLRREKVVRAAQGM